MSSANNTITRDVDNGGGKYSTSANYQMTASAAEEIALTTSTSANNVLRSGFSTIAYYPGTLTALASGATAANSIVLNWPTPGYDGNNTGTAQAGSAYLVQIASAGTLGYFSNLNTIAVSVSTSGTAVGTIVGATAAGLDPNTTYYSQVFLRDSDGNVAGPFTTDYTTFTTLAAAPVVGALEFLSIQQTSVTVAWIAPAAVAVGSSTNEGYILQTSSNNFGALGPPGAPVISSTTFSSQASTLTVGVGATPLDLSNTYYFQVGSLNWAGQPNYATFTRLNFQISQSTTNFSLGTINPAIAMSTVSTSSMVVTNVGNWPATITLSASTGTAGTPWTLAASTGIDTVALFGVWASGAVGPAPTSFATPLLMSTATSQSYPGNYASTGGTAESGYQIPVGGNSSLWVQFWLPTTTSVTNKQILSVSASAVYP